jgi:hypothetical protein
VRNDFARIVACVNALAGIPDPATHLAAMREAIKEAHEALDCLTLAVGLTPIAGNKEALQEANDQARAVLTKLQPFLK